MANKLRVLCLHGYGQDGDAFRAKSGSCRKDSKKLAEFEFVTSPQHIEPGAGPGAGHPDHADDGSDPGRFWWDFNSEANQMRGFDETVAFLAQVFEERGPFDGVLAFSQGAGLLAILMAMLQRGELPAAITFRFGCLVSGFHPRDTTYRAVLDAQPLTIPSLHIYGDTDGIIVPEKSKDLAAAWEPGAATVLTHSGGHLMPSAAPVRKGLKQFLQAQLEAGGGSPSTAQRKKPVHTKQMQKAPKPKPEPSAAAAAPVAAAASPSPSGGGSGERPWRVSFVRGGRVGAAAWSVQLTRAAAPSRVAWPALNEHATNDQLREALVAAQQKLQQLAERVELLESSPAPTSLPQAPAPAPAPAPTKAKSKGGDGGGSASELSFRAVVMRCDSCSLLVDNKDEWVHIGPGFIIGLCFLKGASAQGGTVRKAVQTFLSMPIGEKEGQGAGKLAGTPCTIAEAGANEVMVVPQASLAGKMKNKRMQYHNACKKDLGEELYHDFCEVMAKELEVVKHGTYGNTQGLKLSAACGPFTSYFEF